MASLNKKRVLVVDDDPELLELIADVLKLADFEVEAVRSGPAALEKIQERPPDLLLTDFHLGRSSGADLARRVGKLAAELPIIVLTGHSSESPNAAALAKVADLVLVKPIDSQELVAAVKRLVEPPATPAPPRR